MPPEVVVLALLDSLDLLMTTGVAVTAVSLSSSPLADVTLLQWRALRVAENPVRVSEMAQALDLSVPSTSKIIKRLQGRGLVELRRGRGDERVRMVETTALGATAREAVVARRREYLANAVSLAGLQGDPRFEFQLRRLAEVLATFR